MPCLYARAPARLGTCRRRSAAAFEASRRTGEPEEETREGRLPNWQAVEVEKERVTPRIMVDAAAGAGNRGGMVKCCGESIGKANGGLFVGQQLSSTVLGKNWRRNGVLVRVVLRHKLGDGEPHMVISTATDPI